MKFRKYYVIMDFPQKVIFLLLENYEPYFNFELKICKFVHSSSKNILNSGIDQSVIFHMRSKKH